MSRSTKEDPKEQYARLKAAYDELASRHAELQGSYYLSGVQKKIDVAALPGFADVAARVKAEGRSGMHLDRLYTLWQAVESLPATAQAVAEIGVYRGGSAWFIADALRRANRELPFYVCDTFQGHVEVDETLDGLHRPGEQFTRVKAEKVAKYLRGFPFVRMQVGDIRETAPTFAAESAFGFVHLDVDVYPITRYCLDFFGQRLVPGGVIVMDDYGTTTCEGVKKAMDEFRHVNPGFRVLHLLTGQAVVTKLY